LERCAADPLPEPLLGRVVVGQHLGLLHQRAKLIAQSAQFALLLVVHGADPRPTRNT
jgi:hypothetical protein